MRFIQKLKESYYDAYEVDMLQATPQIDKLTKEHFVHAKIRGDQIFGLPFQRLVQGRMNSGNKGKSFLYRFAVDSPTQNNHRNRWYGKESTGVSHAGKDFQINYNFFLLKKYFHRRD